MTARPEGTSRETASVVAHQPVGDAPIRAALRQRIIEQSPGVRVVDEIDTGASRIDVAVISDVLTGFEIKSWRDSLARLHQQSVDYSRICDLACVVATVRHMDNAALVVPDWWGLLLVVQTGNAVTFDPLRPMLQNPRIDVKQLTFLLWRDEMLAVLQEHGITRRVSSKPRRFLVDVLHADVPLPALRTSILRTLRTRENWRLPVDPSLTARPTPRTTERR